MKPAAPSDPLAQLTEIRAIMERSSRFLSLSGLSGVGAGVVALLGAAAGYLYLQNEFPEGYLRLLQASEPERRAALPFLLLLAGRMIGLALLNASKYTLDEIRWLGLTQIGLGLLAMLQPGGGLVYFALGFGLGHIGYGLLMYNRYERAGALAKPVVSS